LLASKEEESEMDASGLRIEDIVDTASVAETTKL
jgi:hypothetical protein